MLDANTPIGIQVCIIHGNTILRSGLSHELLEGDTVRGVMTLDESTDIMLESFSPTFVTSRWLPVKISCLIRAIPPDWRTDLLVHTA